jgi:hypothetical protein
MGSPAGFLGTLERIAYSSVIFRLHNSYTGVYLHFAKMCRLTKLAPFDLLQPNGRGGKRDPVVGETSGIAYKHLNI